MDAGDLKVFAAVARLGGMNRAAGELGTVQSNVTTRIRQLEQELGTALFDRHSRGVTVTAAGRRLLPYADRIKRLLDEAGQAARDDGRPRGPLAIGALESTAALRLPGVLADYARAHRAVDVTWRTGTSCELVEDVLAGRLDGAFVCGPVEHPDLASQIMFREELVVLTAPDCPSLSAALAQQELRIAVLRAGCSYRQRLEAILAKRGTVGLRCLEFGTLETIFAAVGAGLGITLLPGGLIGPVWRAGRVAAHRLPASEAHVSTLFVQRRDRRASSALSAFLALVVRHRDTIQGGTPERRQRAPAPPSRFSRAPRRHRIGPTAG